MRLLPALLVAAVTGAAAPDRPAVLPLHDVTVDYRIDSTAALPVSEIRVSAQAGAERIRVEQADNLVLLVDRGRRQVVMLLSAQHAALALPWPRQVQQGFDTLQHARFIRRGVGTQVGLACTIYDVMADAARLTVCLTGDGVALRVDGTMRRETYHLAATAVSYAPLDATLFATPPGLTQLQMPSFGH